MHPGPAGLGAFPGAGQEAAGAASGRAGELVERHRQGTGAPAGEEEQLDEGIPVAEEVEDVATRDTAHQVEAKGVETVGDVSSLEEGGGYQRDD